MIHHLLHRFWQWLHRTTPDYVSDAWISEHVTRSYDDNPSSKASRKDE